MSAAKKRAPAGAPVQPSPGPWAVTGPRDENGNLFVSDDAGRFVAKVHFRNPSNDGLHASEANARLIAAAPDLLEEMEKQAHSLAVLKLQAFKDPDVRALLEEMHAGARAAIAKARDQ